MVSIVSREGSWSRTGTETHMLFSPTQSSTSWSRGLACSVASPGCLPPWVTVAHTGPAPSPLWHCPLPPLPALEGAASRLVGKAHSSYPFHGAQLVGWGRLGYRTRGSPGCASRGPAGGLQGLATQALVLNAWRILVLLGLLSAYWVEMKSLQFAARLACM